MRFFAGLLILTGFFGIWWFFFAQNNPSLPSHTESNPPLETTTNTDSIFSIEPNVEDKTLRILIGGNISIESTDTELFVFRNIQNILDKQDAFVLNQKSLIKDPFLNDKTNGLHKQNIDILAQNFISHLLFLDGNLFSEGDFPFQLSQGYSDKQGIQPLTEKESLTISSHDFSAHIIGIHALRETPQSIHKKISQHSQQNPTIVLIDFGVFHKDFISTEMRKVAHKAIESGADIVIGVGNSNILPAEEYNSRPIFYSLGNMITDSNAEGIFLEISCSSEFKKIFLHPFSTNTQTKELALWSTAQSSIAFPEELFRSLSPFLEGKDFRW